MKKIFFLLSTLLLTVISIAQTDGNRIAAAFEKFEADSQLRSAISSLYIIDAETGKVVFDKNSRIGLATASTLKVITAASAYELLGKDFRYKTEFGYKGEVQNSILKGWLYLIGSGDPTFGSWRYSSSNPMTISNGLLGSLKKADIQNDSLHPTSLLLDLSRYSDDVYNEGWIWQDLGNYYGIGSAAINWRENQFDVIVTPGEKEGDDVKAIKTAPSYVSRLMNINNFLLTGKRGSGDNAYFYLGTQNVGSEYLLNLKGTIPAGVDSFVVSASHPNPPHYFLESLVPRINGLVDIKSPLYNLFGRTAYYWGGDSSHFEGFTKKSTILYTHLSPSLDSITYFFLKRSVNLYGESLIKTIAYEKKGFGSTDGGLDILRNFWKGKGIDPIELNMQDGSGLSPLNRVTTHAQVQVLRYAQKQSWFNGFFHGFPEYNGMKMKSGTINGVKGFCGYHTSKDGKKYIFSFLVNNYNGGASRLVNKMYKVLDELK